MNNRARELRLGGTVDSHSFAATVAARGSGRLSEVVLKMTCVQRSHSFEGYPPSVT